MKYLLGLVLSFLVIASLARADGFTIGSFCQTAGCEDGIDPQQPVHLDGGYVLNLRLPLPATEYINFDGSRFLTYGAGGSFDLDLAGQTMMTGTFLAGASEEISIPLLEFTGNFVIDYLNPHLLKSFGLPRDLKGGTGGIDIESIYLPGPDHDYQGGAIISAQLTIPEPNTGLLVGACFLASMMTLLRRRARANCLTR
jgi:hypothetical protein